MNIINKIKRRVYIVEHFKNIEKGVLSGNRVCNPEVTRDLLYNYRDVLSGYEFICFDRLLRNF